jgi:hypothetical protein
MHILRGELDPGYVWKIGDLRKAGVEIRIL